MTIRSSDRRRSRRSDAQEHGIISARVRFGYRVAVIDVSVGGALIEAATRLLPGATVDLQVDTAHRQTTVRGRVLRCAIVRLRSSSVWYRAAIAFDRQWPSFINQRSTEYPIPVGETPTPHAARVDSTQDAV